VEELSANLSTEDVCLGNPSPLNYQVVSGTPHQLHFDFGNGETSTNELKEYTFGTAGIKKVKLTLTNSVCKVTETVSTFVKDKPKSNFVYSDGCYGDSSKFINQTPHSDSITYQWLFADGNASVVRNPAHKYASNTTKTYVVTLKSAYTNGCRDSLSKPLTITETPTCGFTVKRDPMNGNNAFIFTPNVIGSNAYLWDFGNGKTSTDTIAKHQYFVNGVFYVSLSVQNEATCKCEGTEPLNAGFLGQAGLSEELDLIYPNPFTNQITVVLPNRTATFNIVDVTGKLVKKGVLQEGANVLNVSDVASGTYWMEVSTDSAVKRTKIVKTDRE
jgi:hypothetical protein